MIELRGVSRTYGSGETLIKALDDVSLKIDVGEFVTVIGHSGSGKSTLMNILGLLDEPTQGEYLFNGEPVVGLSQNKQAEIRNVLIGFVFQNFNLIPALSAVENVELPLMYRGFGRAERRERAMNALRAVGLESRADHRPCEMSGGQQQRTAIARAVAGDPPLILADEPTGNLDPAAGKDVMALLRENSVNGRTVVLITHDSSLAALSPRKVEIYDGRVAADTCRSQP
jgi:putative ABC transport system ATP-binding protein